MTNDRFGIVRRSFLLASVWGFVATPVFANFGHPVHTHSAKIEARLKVWRDHVAKEHDYLIQSREPHIVRWPEWTEHIPSNSE
jgi:hypothetical protein